MTEEQLEADRQRVLAVDKERRWKQGTTPRHLSLSATQPWLAENVSRRTWYRRHRPARGTVSADASTAVPQHEQGHSTEQVVLPAWPQAPASGDRSGPAPAPTFIRGVPDPAALTEPAPPALTVTGTTVSMEEWTVEDCVERASASSQARDEIVRALQWSRNADFWTRFYSALDARRRTA
jgi:hypothetical protein